MKRTTLRSGFGFIALLTLALAAAAPAHAVNIGTLGAGDSFSDTISSPGPTFSQDYSFSLTGTSGLTVLATSLGQTSANFGIDSLSIKLFDSGNNLIASASGAPFAFFDSFAQTGIPLGAGAYLFTVFGDVTAGKQAFVSISLAANDVAPVPIPAGGLLLLTGLGALGVITLRRRASSAPVAATAT